MKKWTGSEIKKSLKLPLGGIGEGTFRPPDQHKAKIEITLIQFDLLWNWLTIS